MRPLKALRGFRRVRLAPGEKVVVKLTLGPAELSHWDPGAQAWVVEPGPVEILVGRSSRDADLSRRRTIRVRPPTPTPPQASGAASSSDDGTEASAWAR
jgi:beta-glucosidase